MTITTVQDDEPFLVDKNHTFRYEIKFKQGKNQYPGKKLRMAEIAENKRASPSPPIST